MLDPGQTYRIDGFRQSRQEVAAFRFGDVSESYAAATGDDANVGVIGVAFFAERGRRPAWRDRDHESARRRDADPFPAGWPFDQSNNDQSTAANAMNKRYTSDCSDL